MDFVSRPKPKRLFLRRVVSVWHPSVCAFLPLLSSAFPLSAHAEARFTWLNHRHKCRKCMEAVCHTCSKDRKVRQATVVPRGAYLDSILICGLSLMERGLSGLLSPVSNYVNQVTRHPIIHNELRLRLGGKACDQFVLSWHARAWGGAGQAQNRQGGRLHTPLAASTLKQDRLLLVCATDRSPREQRTLMDGDLGNEKLRVVLFSRAKKDRAIHQALSLARSVQAP